MTSSVCAAAAPTHVRSPAWMTYAATRNCAWEKEQQLTEELRQTEAKLLELSQGSQPGGDALVLSEAQQTEVDRFTQENCGFEKNCAMCCTSDGDINEPSYLAYGQHRTDAAAGHHCRCFGGSLAGTASSSRRATPRVLNTTTKRRRVMPKSLAYAVFVLITAGRLWCRADVWRA